MEIHRDTRQKSLPVEIAKTTKVKHTHLHSSLLLWMLVDGIGLAIVAGATVMEGIHIWKEFLYIFWSSNQTSLIFWFGGRTLQVVGLMILIGFAASFQLFPSIEQFGMLLITTGPLLNMISSQIFQDPEDPSRLYNQQWITTEIVEFTGMCVLDISLIHMEEIYVLCAELVGFFILCCAAILQYAYVPGVAIPSVTARLDIVHVSECIGLILLSIVAIAQYRIKLNKAEQLKNRPDNTQAHSHRGVTAASPNSVVALSDVEKGYAVVVSHGYTHAHTNSANINIINSPGKHVRQSAAAHLTQAPAGSGGGTLHPTLPILESSNDKNVRSPRSPRKGTLQIV